MVSVRGSGFAPWIQANLDDLGASTVRGTFALTLVRPGQRVALEAVELLSDRELSARVPPLATPVSYDLELVDPRGRAVVLPEVFAVEPEPGCGPDATPCDDGNVCTEGDACRDAACVPGASVCGNTAPRACLSVTPSAAAPGEAISLDASCSTDDEDPLGALRARLDLDGDGTWDTPFAPPGAAAVAPPAPGLWKAIVEVQDAGGLSDFAARMYVVTPADDLVVVTTAADEADAGATPAAPGGTGLSLREAMTWVEALAAPRTIHVAVEQPIVHASALPALSVQGAAIVGNPAALLDFPAVAATCLVLDGADQLLLGATMTGCTAGAVQLGTKSDRSRIAGCTIAPGPTSHGIVGKATGTIGPGNVISGADVGVKLISSSYVLEENEIHGNAVGISVVAGLEVKVWRNRITSNLTFGLQATPSPGACTLLHNVFDANGADAVDVSSFGAGLVARNNLFTRNGGFAIRDGSAIRSLDHNGFFENALGPISSAGPGPTDLLGDPLYAGDHRLAPRSPAIDAGVATEVDVNGPPGGSWNGAAPDLGAWEAPYPAP
jgi:hypothetical protein